MRQGEQASAESLKCILKWHMSLEGGRFGLLLAHEKKCQPLGVCHRQGTQAHSTTETFGGSMKTEIHEALDLIKTMDQSELRNLPKDLLSAWKRDLIQSRKALVEIGSKNGLGVFIRNGVAVTTWNFWHYPIPRKYH